MEIKNIEKLPGKVRKGVSALIGQLIGIYGDETVSIFAYGSVTGAGYNPKTSDVNLAVVLRDISLGKLKISLRAVKKAARNRITAPLFLTPSYINRSLDAFPMEFVEMKESRLVLFGEDILDGIEVKKEDLRRECESQIKGKLLMIRQAYLEQALNRRALKGLVNSARHALKPVLRSITKIKPDFDANAFLPKADKSLEGALEEFLEGLEKLSEIVDHI